MTRKSFVSKFGDLFDFLKRFNSEEERTNFIRKVDSAITALDEPETNPKMEYLVKKVFILHRNDGLEASLNSFGDDGWDLVHYDGDVAIFSRIVE